LQFTTYFLGIVVGIVIYFYTRSWIAPIWAAAIGVFVCVLISTTAITYPRILREQRRTRIDEEMHLFITRLGTLSVSDISRKGMFNLLAQMREYGNLAQEINKIHTLVDKWNTSLPEACRIIAKTTPSELFKDFLERLAYAVETGEEPKVFFRAEQEVVIEEYSANQMRVEKALDVLEEVYISMVIASLFIIIIAALYPLLTGQSNRIYLTTGVFVFAFLQLSFLYLFSVIMPPDHIWYRSDIRTSVATNIERLSIIALIACALFGIIAFLTDFPLLIKLAITFTPLLVPGIYVTREEAKIQRREDNYAAFIRSLGGSGESRGITDRTALKRLREHDFGLLSKNIDDLYKRVSLRINTKESWKYFSAETGSNMISKFNDIYVEGNRAGAKPREVAEIVSENFIRINILRKRRYQHGSVLTGLLYGITFAISMVLFLAYFVIIEIWDMLEDVSTSEVTQQLNIFDSQSFDLGALTATILILVLVHITTSSILTRIVGNAHKLGALVHFVGMLWLAAVTYVASEEVVGYLI